MKGNRHDLIGRIIESEIYLYIAFMFLTKGEAIRNILIFSSFALWLITLRHRENLRILKEPLSLVYWGFIATILVSVAFSIDPLYSLASLRGHPLKSVMMFCLFSTVLAREAALKRFVFLSLAMLLFTLASGYYSYVAYDLPVMKPVTVLRHAWHAQFAVDINTLLPFTLVGLWFIRDRRVRTLIVCAAVLSVPALVLSTSRGGWGAFLATAAVWLIYLVRNQQLSLRKVAAGFLILAAVTGMVVLSSETTQKRFIKIERDLETFTKRTYIWGPLVAASKQRPLTGWGYGPMIFKTDRPFKDTEFRRAPVRRKAAFRNPHNPFLAAWFHQGIPGLVMYTALLLSAVWTFGREALRSFSFRCIFMAACTSVLAGTYIVNAMVENSHLTELTLVLGVGLAARYMNHERGDTEKKIHLPRRG